MPTKTRKPRLIALLAIATLTLGVMAPAMASQPDDVPPAQTESVDGEAIGAEKAAANQLTVDARVEFATVTVQKAIEVFLAEVERFTTCMAETASTNEEGAAENGATLYDDCKALNVEQSPGHYVSAPHIE